MTISAKLKRRHPHVFGDAEVCDSNEVLKQWENIKETIEGGRPKTSALDGIPKTLPPLERAAKMQHKASKTGFDWEDINDVEHKVKEELDELAEAQNTGSRKKIEHEFGDVLFSLINLSRFLDIDPAIALHKANRRFFTRFHSIEERMKELGKKMNKENFDLMDSLWDQAKKNGTS
jgi:MazG family protein